MIVNQEWLQELYRLIGRDLICNLLKLIGIMDF
jgi:hypothetical protein